MKKVLEALFGTATLTLALCGGGCTDEPGSDGEEQAEEPGGEEVGEAAAPLTVHAYGWARIFDGAVQPYRSYNSTGGPITTHNNTVTQEVWFEGIPFNANVNVQVSGYGALPCTLALPPGGVDNWEGQSWTTAHVRCFWPSGSPPSIGPASRATVFIESHSGSGSAPRRGAFLTTEGGTTPVVQNSWNSSGATNTVTWNAWQQRFEVSLPGLNFENAAVHVTGIGLQTSECKVLSWSYGTVLVRCFDVARNPISSSGFSLTYQEGSLSPGHVGGHAWAAYGAAPTSYSATVGAPTCSTPAAPTFAPDSIPGAAIVTFHEQAIWSGLQAGVPMVTSYGDNNLRSCTLENWWEAGTSTQVRVQCWNLLPTPTPVAFQDMQFTVSLTSRYSPKACVP